MSRHDPSKDDRPRVEPDPRFPSGAWEGFYMQNGNKARMKLELHFKRLNFRGGHVCGEGRDFVGAFRMVGTDDLAPGTITARKHYLGQHMVAYQGDYAVISGSDLPGLQGRWDISAHHLSGFWRLWPVEDEEQWELESIEVQTRESPIVITDWTQYITTQLEALADAD